jgi:nicotinamidase-related amidase
MQSLLVIDVQNAIVDGTVTVDRQPIIDQALQNTVDRIAMLQRQARAAGAPVFVVQHDGAPGHRLARGSQGWEIRREVAPIRGDIVINKTHSDAFTRLILQPSLKRVV